MVSGALLAPAGRSARRKLRLLPPIRGSLCRAGQRRSPTHLGRDRPPQPQGEHRADERQGAPDPREGTGSLGPERAPEEDLIAVLEGFPSKTALVSTPPLAACQHFSISVFCLLTAGGLPCCTVL